MSDLFKISRMKELNKLLEKYNHYYYKLASPLIADFEYDKLYKELEELEKKYPEFIQKDSVINKVGEDFDSNSNSNSTSLAPKINNQNKNLDVVENDNENRSNSTLKDNQNKNLEKQKTYKHKLPMISLANSYTVKDIYDWNLRITKKLKEFSEKLDEENEKYIINQFEEIYDLYEEKTSLISELKKFVLEKNEYVLEPKIDGVSVSVIYENGKLVRCLTRGDGVSGEDITHNVLATEMIPLDLHEVAKNKNLSEHFFIPNILEIRGEAYIENSNFIDLNNNRLKNKEEVFANSRNATAGTLKLLDSTIVKSRN
ncbi:MAG: hypothetical protein LBF97_06680, partial [Elusimicrobiota bacterium]|nr:hypothetical protein [Elusimicrobiota bacterium]